MNQHTNPFTVGQKITCIHIDSLLALSHRQELTVKSVLAEPVPCGYSNLTTRYGTMTVRGKRKEFYLQGQADDTIWLAGWDLPVQVDSEVGNCFSGNACFNLVGDGETIRGLLDSALVVLSDEAKAKVIVLAGPQHAVSQEGQLLYPELESIHAVVNRMRDDKH